MLGAWIAPGAKIPPMLEDHRRRLRLRRPPRGGALTAARSPFFRTMLPLESKLIQARWSGQAAWIPFGDLDVGDRPGGSDQLPGPGRARLLPRRRQRDRDPVPVRRHLLREQGGPARGQPLRDDRRGEREPARVGGASSGRERRRSSSSRRCEAFERGGEDVDAESDVFGLAPLLRRVTDAAAPLRTKSIPQRTPAAASTPAS